MATELNISARPAGRALVLDLSGSFGVVENDLAPVLDAVSAPPRPGVVVIDLRAVRQLPVTGVRTLLAAADALDAAGVRCGLVAEPGGAAAIALRAAELPSTLPVFETLEQALGTEPRPVGSSEAAVALDALAGRLADMTQALVGTTTVGSALRTIVHAAFSIVPGADVVSVTLRDADGRFFTPMETDAVAGQLDKVQYRAGAGPCVDAALPDGPAYAASGDLAKETRWPEFAAAATRVGLAAVLSTDLRNLDRPGTLRGALNLYSRRAHALDGEAQHTALVLATHAALALAYTHTIELAEAQHQNLHRAVESRDVIGQAKGILMARQGMTAEDAFDVLRRASQDLNIKLVDLARRLAARPGVPDPRQEWGSDIR